jgi:hypothetical protein
MPVPDLPSSFVYDHPTIESLAKYATGAATTETKLAIASKADDLEGLVLRYTAAFPTHTPTLPALDKDVVLVTGTTGSLGSAVLAELVTSEAVRHVYAFNRRSSRQSILERQQEALALRGYDQAIATSPKVTLVEGKLTAAGLGLKNIALQNEVRLGFNMEQQKSLTQNFKRLKPMSPTLYTQAMITSYTWFS